MLSQLHPRSSAFANIILLIGVLITLSGFALRSLYPRDTEALSGRWEVHVTVDRSDFSKYKGLEMDFTLYLVQDGDRVRGSGEKNKENGRRLTGRQRTPVQVNGLLRNGHLLLSYTESGVKRTTTGQYDLVRTDDNTLAGPISGTAANATGSTTWERRSK